MSIAILRMERVVTTTDIPVKGPLPLQNSLTGTFTSAGVIVFGSGTTFTKDFVPGDWIYSATTNEIRKVEGVQSDTIMRVSSAFTSPALAQACNRVRGQLLRGLSIWVSGAGAVTINGDSFATGETYSVNSSSGIEPIVYDATGSTITFDLNY